MEPTELNRLQSHYARMNEDELRAALYCGPDAYASSEVWKIIVEEAGRRGTAVPTQAELMAHEADEVAAEFANQPPPVPWGWGLYIWVTWVMLVLVVSYYVDTIVGILKTSDHHEGWQLDLRDYVVQLGLVCVVAWARHRHVAAIRERLRGDRAPGAA